MLPPNIRDIAESDTDQLIALWKATWTSTYGPSLGAEALNAMLDDLNRQGASLMLPGNGERGFCVASGAEIVASLVLRQNGRKAYLWGMYVRPDHQRLGLGSQLLLWAAATLPPGIKIEARVLQTSTHALSFYRKHGFVETGTEATELPGNITVPTSVMDVPVEALNSPDRAV